VGRPIVAAAAFLGGIAPFRTQSHKCGRPFAGRALWSSTSIGVRSHSGLHRGEPCDRGSHLPKPAVSVVGAANRLKRRLRRVRSMHRNLKVKVLYPTWWRWRVSEAQGRRPQGGVWRKCVANTGADDRKSGDKAPTVDELAPLSEVHIHQGRKV